MPCVVQGGGGLTPGGAGSLLIPLPCSAERCPLHAWGGSGCRVGQALICGDRRSRGTGGVC